MPHDLRTHLTDDWSRAVDNVRAAAERLWRTPAQRDLVDYGFDHAERMVGLLGGLTESLMSQGEQPLAAEEIYILLAATYLHAIGLQDEAGQPDFQTRWARYPELSAELIYRTLDEPDGPVALGLIEDEGLVELVALTVAGQRRTDFPGPDYDDWPVGRLILRPRLLAGLLHLANRLDLDYHRVDLSQLNLMPLAPAAALNWWLHHYVSGVQMRHEFIQVAYRLPPGRAEYETALPELVESELRHVCEILQPIYRLYGLKPAVGPATCRVMRAVKPMPDDLWAEAEKRLAQLRGEKPAEPTLSPLVETVQSLLQTMGYQCDPPQTPAAALTTFAARPQGGGLQPPLLIGCRTGPLEAADVKALAGQLNDSDQQGYLIAENRVLDSARRAAGGQGRVRLFTLAEFYRQLLDFEPYVTGLVDAYRDSDLARYYVALGCVRYSYDPQGGVLAEDRYKPLDDYLDTWLRESLADGERNHISILGDYGAGKTSFCRQYAAKQGRRWLADPDRERLPLLLNLRDYSKTLAVDSLITSALINQYGVRGATFAAFERFNADGKLLILFDGFDEMAARTGQRTAVDNFWELAKVVVPGSKVVLTCRTPYFRTHHEARRLLAGPVAEATGVESETMDEPFIDLRHRPNFDIIHLEPFSDADIQAVLQARFPAQAQDYWAQIQAIYNLADLARRPVLLDMIAQTLPQLQPGQTLNAARLYQVYTDLWLEREQKKGRTLLSGADRRFFAESLAMTMLRSGELSLHYSRLPERISRHFQLEKAQELDYFDSDIRTCNFLNRDEAGHYRFSHKSFMEFFAACYLHRLMLQDQATANGPVRINEEVRYFLTDLFALTPKAEPGPPGEPPQGFVWVPPGEFVLGGYRGFDLQITRLAQGFYAAVTPVTNAQYAQFVAETGHRSPRHWRGNQPPAEVADRPVIYVSWHDAMAYCGWAGTRLPTEEEWEKAARSYDGRDYPWGQWVEGRCNTRESGIGQTSPVGQFSPAGDSPYGLQDAAGNVWEWTANEAGRGRVLRGGAFNNFRVFARCSFRFYLLPGDLNLNYGFRVVVSPNFPPSAI